MTDYLIRATAANAQIRAFACTSRGVAEKARQSHNTSPVMTAALGRLLTGGAMMGAMLKGEKDLLTLRIKGDGPAGGLTVTADACGNVKGYADVPDVILPAKPNGKLDVSGAVGKGYLSVCKDLGMKEPYVGQTDLQTGEIAEDLTYYFAASEQVPSSVGLGVLMEKNNTVRQAGGFIIQLMPFAEEAVIEKLEQNLAGISAVTTLLEEGKGPEEILEVLLAGLSPQVSERMPVRFACNCSREKIQKVLVSIGAKELRAMIEEGEDIEVNCHFCNTNYTFSVEELKEIYETGFYQSGGSHTEDQGGGYKA
ncbi:MAG: Hsp33 family molecular chaperone HslO [Candidatus Gastranaerophilales bacterium]|nr:Hsp33 family molecular chaperone HslO [Candidatus Gastranaerophilales bacterium]